MNGQCDSAAVEGDDDTPPALTVEQAKQGLAVHFGVSPEQIDIQVTF